MSLKSKREKFDEGRTPLLGDEFALRVAAPAERQPFVLAARAALAGPATFALPYLSEDDPSVWLSWFGTG